MEKNQQPKDIHSELTANGSQLGYMNNNKTTVSNQTPTLTTPMAADAARSPGTNANSYHDCSHIFPDPSITSTNHRNLPASALKDPTFPVKLHLMLSDPEVQDIIAWLPHGRAWRVLRQREFEERIIPLYFRHGRYSSFARQVNGWGFKRITHGSDYNAYYHEMFLRGMPHLCAKMRRLTTADNAKKKQSQGAPAPDFYKMSEENPLPEDVPLPRHLRLLAQEGAASSTSIGGYPTLPVARMAAAAHDHEARAVADLFDQQRLDARVSRINQVPSHLSPYMPINQTVAPPCDALSLGRTYGVEDPTLLGQPFRLAPAPAPGTAMLPSVRSPGMPSLLRGLNLPQMTDSIPNSDVNSSFGRQGSNQTGSHAGRDITPFYLQLANAAEQRQKTTKQVPQSPANNQKAALAAQISQIMQMDRLIRNNRGNRSTQVPRCARPSPSA